MGLEMPNFFLYFEHEAQYIAYSELTHWSAYRFPPILCIDSGHGLAEIEALYIHI
jgi:hypothetical protein